MAFKLINGDTFEDKHNYSDRKYSRTLVERIDEDGTVLRSMPEAYKNSLDKRITEKTHLYDFKKHRSHTVTDTYLLGENEDYVEHANLKEYNEFGIATNINHFHKVEVLLMSEEWQKKLYFHWNGHQSLVDFITNIKSLFVSALDNNELESQGLKWQDSNIEFVKVAMWSNNGEVIQTETTLRSLIRAIVNVRVVEFH